MSRTPAGRRFVAARAMGAALALTSWVGAVGWSQAGRAEALPFPLDLEDPLTAEKVRLEPGPEVLHVVFLATWCPTCLEELPRIAELEARWGEQGYRLVLVAVPTRQTRKRLRTFLREQAPPGELLLDVTGAVQRACGADRLPTHLVVDREGRLVLRAPAFGEAVESAVEKLLWSPIRTEGFEW